MSQRREALANFLCFFFYETLGQTSHRNINQGIFENILKNTEKKSISNIDVYEANEPKWTFSVIFWNILKNSLIYIFVRYLSYSHLKIHRKLTSDYLLCDKATLNYFSKAVICLKAIGGMRNTREWRAAILSGVWLILLFRGINAVISNAFPGIIVSSKGVMAGGIRNGKKSYLTPQNLLLIRQPWSFFFFFFFFYTFIVDYFR